MTQPPHDWSPQHPPTSPGPAGDPFAQLPGASPPANRAQPPAVQSFPTFQDAPDPFDPKPPTPVESSDQANRKGGWLIPAAAGFAVAAVTVGVLFFTNVVSIGAPPASATGQSASQSDAAESGAAESGAAESSAAGSGAAGSGAAGSGPVDTTPITLPTTLGAMQDHIEHLKTHVADQNVVATQTARITADNAMLQDQYVQAFGGATVAVGNYVTEDAKTGAVVVAIRAPSPGLFRGQMLDLEQAGLAASPASPELITDGEVECFVAPRQDVPAGQVVDPNTLVTNTCHRSNDSVSIYTYGNGTGPEGRQIMIDVTNAAFEAIA